MEVNSKLKEIAEHLVTNGIKRDEALSAFDKIYIIAGLKFTDGNASQAAKALGMHRNSIIRNLPERREVCAVIRQRARRKREYEARLSSAKS